MTHFIERYSAQVKYDPARQYEVLVVGTRDQPACDKGIGEFALHICDFCLYYYNICENAKKRVHSYFNQLKSSTPAPHRQNSFLLSFRHCVTETMPGKRNPPFEAKAKTLSSGCYHC